MLDIELLAHALFVTPPSPIRIRPPEIDHGPNAMKAQKWAQESGIGL
jgi:hypothetical protein